MTGHHLTGASAELMGLLVILITLILQFVIVVGFILWALVSGIGVLYTISRIPHFIYRLYHGQPLASAARQATSEGTAALGYIGIVTSMYLAFVGLFGQMTAVVVRAQVEMAQRAGQTSRFAEALKEPQGPEELAMAMALMFGPAVIGVFLLFISEKLDPIEPEESLGLDDTVGGDA